MTDKDHENYGLFMYHYSNSLPRLRSFLRQLLPSWNDVDEVLQETSMVLWKKFADFEEGTNFAAWACMVARFEVLKYRRKKSRDRHFFSDEVLNLLADEVVDDQDRLELQRRALDGCFQQLDEKQQQLTLASYAAGNTIREVAEEHGRSAGALYKALDRIRHRLLKCINTQVQKGDLA